MKINGGTNLSNKKKYLKKEPTYRRLFSSFLVCFVFITLFTVRIHVETIGENSQKLFSNNNGLYIDWFLYCKEILLFIIAIICICYFISEKIFPDNPCRNDPILKKSARLPAILLGMYLLMTIISAIFSENKDVVLWGVCSEYEGVIAIFSYCILFFAGYNYFNTEKAWKFYKRAFFILISATVVLSVFEYTIMPLIKLPFMKYIISPSKYKSIAESLDFTNGYHEAVLMFYNSNYMGGFCSLIFPISVYYVIASDKKLSKIICSILSAACFIVVIMSNSTAAFYVVIAEILFIMIFLIAKKVVSVKSVALIFASFVILAGSISAVSDNAFISNIIKSISNESRYDESSHQFKIDNFNINRNTIMFSGNGSEYYITPPTESGEKLKVSGSENTVYTLDSPDINNIFVNDVNNNFAFSVSLKDGIVYLDLGYISTIDFAVTSDGVKLIVQNAQLIDNIPHSSFDNSKLSKFYGFATGRGYIWINSLPILKDCIFIGKGSGNFPFYFNQNELVGLLNTHGTYRIIVDKPHNWYLQIAITCGIPALIAVLILFIYFIISGFKIIIKTPKTQIKMDKDRFFLIFLYTGLCGFMIIGLSNDSCITVNPFFWFNLGIAYLRTNELIKVNLNEKN